MKKIILFIILLANIISAKDTITVSVHPSPPFVIENNGKYSGLSIWLLNKLSNELDFDYLIKKEEIPDIIKSLQSGQSDLSINPLTITPKRLEKIDFTLPFFVGHSSIAVKENQWGKWLSTIINFFSFDFLKVIGLLLLVIVFFGFFAWLFERKENEEFQGEGLKGFLQGVWWSAVTMTTVGYGDKSPRTFAGRVIAFVWMFTAIVIISGFTASITSSLTVNSLSDKVSSIKDLKDFVNGSISGSATKQYLLDNNINCQVTNSIEEGLLMLNNEEIETFVYDNAILKYSIDNSNFKDLKVLPYKFNEQYYALGLPKNSLMKDKLSMALIKIIKSSDWKSQLTRYGLSDL